MQDGTGGRACPRNIPRIRGNFRFYENDVQRPTLLVLRTPPNFSTANTRGLRETTATSLPLSPAACRAATPCAASAWTVPSCAGGMPRRQKDATSSRSPERFHIQPAPRARPARNLVSSPTHHARNAARHVDAVRAVENTLGKGLPRDTPAAVRDLGALSLASGERDHPAAGALSLAAEDREEHPRRPSPTDLPSGVAPPGFRSRSQGAPMQQVQEVERYRAGFRPNGPAIHLRDRQHLRQRSC